jgi:hypothetical protein
MRHIHLFEDFNNVPDEMRDLFGLTAEVEIANYDDEWSYVMIGPSEHQAEAERAAEKIRPHIIQRYQDWFVNDAAEDTDINDYIDDYVFNHIPKSLYEPIGYHIVRKPATA